MTERSFSLLGSGEFEPWSEEADRWLLERSARSGPVLVSPTASAPEGEDVFQRWGRMGLAHFAEMGVPVQLLELRGREDAFRADLAERLRDSRLVYFSGGNPAYLSEALAGTPFWDVLTHEVSEGLPYAGCSAGVAALGIKAPDSAAGLSERTWRAGLALFPRTLFGPHWDRIDVYLPGATAAIADAVPDGARLFAIDERTAAVGDGRAWTVVGSGSVRLLEDAGWRTYGAGACFDVDLLRSAEMTEGPA
jgi:cyanophycinase-like exopeptidase